jgi:hypothetical protein
MFFLSFPFVALCNSPSPASVVWQEITPICRLKSATSNQDDAGPNPLIPPSLGVGGNIPLNITAAQQIIPVSRWVIVASHLSVMLKAVGNIPLSVPPQRNVLSVGQKTRTVCGRKYIRKYVAEFRWVQKLPFICVDVVFKNY